MGEVGLEESFVPVRVRPWVADRAAAPSRAAGGTAGTLAEALEAHGLVLIVGPAGTGKSALVRWHAIEVARTAL
jgi:hypothetical protein